MGTTEAGIPEDVKDEVVRLYLAHAKNSEITEATGVERSSIYWILDQRGIEPNRQRRRGFAHGDMLLLLAEANQEIGRLRHERDSLLQEIDRLKAKLASNGYE